MKEGFLPIGPERGFHFGRVSRIRAGRARRGRRAQRFDERRQGRRTPGPETRRTPFYPAGHERQADFGSSLIDPTARQCFPGRRRTSWVPGSKGADLLTRVSPADVCREFLHARVQSNTDLPLSSASTRLARAAQPPLKTGKSLDTASSTPSSQRRIQRVAARAAASRNRACRCTRSGTSAPRGRASRDLFRLRKVVQPPDVEESCAVQISVGFGAARHVIRLLHPEGHLPRDVLLRVLRSDRRERRSSVAT